MSYCASLTTAQVEHVLADEADRINRHPDGPADVVLEASKLYHDAREVLASRNIDPDTVLAERGIPEPE